MKGCLKQPVFMASVFEAVVQYAAIAGARLVAALYYSSFTLHF